MIPLEEDFNFGKVVKEELSSEVVRALEDSYEQTAVQVNRKPNVVIKQAALSPPAAPNTPVPPTGTPDASGHIPSTVDVDYSNGTIWIAQTDAIGPITNQVYMKTQTIVSGGNKTALWVRLI